MLAILRERSGTSTKARPMVASEASSESACRVRLPSPRRTAVDEAARTAARSARCGRLRCSPPRPPSPLLGREDLGGAARSSIASLSRVVANSAKSAAGRRTAAEEAAAAEERRAAARRMTTRRRRTPPASVSLADRPGSVLSRLLWLAQLRHQEECA